MHSEDDIILDHREIIQFKEDLSALPNPHRFSSLSAYTGHHMHITDSLSWGFAWGEMRWVSESEEDVLRFVFFIY